MKKIGRILGGLVIFLLALAHLAGGGAEAERLSEEGARESYNFNYGWTFSKGAGRVNSGSSVQPVRDESYVDMVQRPYSTDYDDSSWEQVSLPHTYNDTDTFDNFTEPGVNGERSMYTGTAWYRKSFTIPAEYADKKIYLEFEAARQAAEVYVNGQKLEGTYLNGFTPFGYDLTPYILFGQENQITVMTDNSFPYGTSDGELPWHDSHWHPNYGGLYRNAYLHVTDKLHITLPLYSFIGTEGVYVYTSDESRASAEVHVEAQVANEYTEPKSFTVRAEVIDMDGSVVATASADMSLEPGAMDMASLTARLTSPIFWSTDYPYTYTVRTRIFEGESEVDRCDEPMGVRTFRFTTDKGFYLNENYLKLNGWGQKPTNEWAAVGAAYPEWMHDYVLKKMKDAGSNFLRWGHSAGSPGQIRMADKYGLLTIQPGVDGEGNYTIEYTDTTFGIRVDAMRDMIIYYRNNPSIFIWEVANHGTSLSEARIKALIAQVDKYDHHGYSSGAGKANVGSAATSRPDSRRVTGMRIMNKVASPYVDVAITTQGGSAYENKPLVEGEYNREEARRGVWDKYTAGSIDFKNQSETKDYRELTSELFAANQAKTYTEMIGSEKNSGGGNWIFSDSISHGRVTSEVARASGEVDAMMLEKEAYYAIKTIFTDETDIHIIGHWNYPDGTKKDVFVVSDAERVTLYLNGESLGTAQPVYEYLFRFVDVEYQPGRLVAVGEDAGGGELCSTSVSTHGEPASIRLTPLTGPNGLLANGSDVLLVDVEVLDSDGARCLTFGGYSDPYLITFALNDQNGASIWRGGYNSGLEGSTNKKTLYIEAGITRVAIRTTMLPGEIELTASIPGLPTAALNIASAPVDNDGGLSRDENATPRYDLTYLPVSETGNVRADSSDDQSSVASDTQPEVIGGLSLSGGAADVKYPAASGAAAYSDSEMTFSELPGALINAEYAYLPLEAANSTVSPLVEFTALSEADIYLAFDGRLSPPEWLGGTGFAGTGQILTVEGVDYSIYHRAAAAGEALSLGPVSSSPGEGDRMYILFARAQGSSGAFFEDDFERNQVGAAPAGWIVEADENTSATVELTNGPDGAETKAVRLNDAGEGYALIARQLAPITSGKYSVEWKLKDAGAKNTKYIRMLMHSGPPKRDLNDKSGFLSEMYLNASGSVQYRKAVDSPASNVTTLKKNNWHTMRYDVDMDARTFDIYVDGARCVSGAKLMGDAQAAFDCLIFGTGSNYWAEVYIDDVKITVE